MSDFSARFACVSSTEGETSGGREMTLSPRWNENKKCKLGPADEEAAWACVHMEISPRFK